MKFKNLIYFIALLFISTYSLGANIHNDLDKYCLCKYLESAKNYLNRPIEDVLREWKKYDKECAAEGIYERYIADIYAAFGQYKQAEEILETTIKKANYDTKRLEFFLGIVHNKNKETSKYKSLIDHMLNKYPNWFGGYYHLGIYTLNYKNDYEKGKRLLLQALEKVYNGYAHYILCDLAITEHSLGNHKKVLEYYEQAFTINPLYVATNLNLAIPSIYSFIELKDFQAASDVIRNIEQYDPSVLKNADYLEAKSYYEKMVKNTEPVK